MNIAEILKNVPKGTKLYSPAFGDVIFEEIRQDYIRVRTNNIIREFYSDGRYYANGECMLFPSRENRDWNTFISFKKGDILEAKGSIFIYNGITNVEFNTLGAICGINYLGNLITEYPSKDKWCYKKNTRKATDEEIKSFYDKLKEEGYTWNAHDFTITKVIKFDINELKPFDKVLVRDTDYNNWRCRFFDSISGISDFKFRTTASINTQCIPYNDETRHLVGTKEPCPEYYKNW